MTEWFPIGETSLLICTGYVPAQIESWRLYKYIVSTTLAFCQKGFTSNIYIREGTHTGVLGPIVERTESLHNWSVGLAVDSDMAPV